MIDATTGILTINPDLVLDPTGATGLFQRSATPTAWEVEQQSAEWRSFERKPIRDAAGRKLAVRAYLERVWGEAIARFRLVAENTGPGQGAQRGEQE